MFDITVIGAGIIGGAIARELGKYDLKVCILEKENDVAMGTTKANSAIIHAGFDALEGSLKAKLNVKGSMMMEGLVQDLGVKYKKNGSLVIGFNESDLKQIKVLYKRGVNNGVKDLKILSKEELKSFEPNVSNNATCALYAPTSAIVCPYELTIALIGNAMDNGVELYRNFVVEKIDGKDGFYEIVSTGGQKVESRYIINCAGLFSDSIAKMVGDDSFNVTPRRGEYLLLDRECKNIIKHTIFIKLINHFINNVCMISFAIQIIFELFGCYQLARHIIHCKICSNHYITFKHYFD
jgi:glycerol-3-phosphate dehydrogenase